MTEAIPIPENETQVILTLASFAVAIQEVNRESFPGLDFSIAVAGGNADPNAQLDEDSVSYSATENPTASLSLPSSLFHNLTSPSANTARITQSVFLSDLLFLRREENFLSVAGVIMAASVVGEEVQVLQPAARLTFKKNPVGIYTLVNKQLE